MSDAPPAASAPPRGELWAAALVYMLLAAWALRAIVPAPATTLPSPVQTTAKFEPFQRGDQQLVVATVTRHARNLLRHPWNLYDDGHCHPVRNPVTLGEPMLVEGLLAAAPLAASGKPVLAFNLTLWATLWIAALGMCALVRAWTGDLAAGLVAGLLFGFAPLRIVDTAHPFVHGDLWGPYLLLSLQRLLQGRGWTSALALTVAASLQVAESLYPLIEVTLISTVVGTALAWRYRAGLRRTVIPLLVVTTVVVAVATLVFAPYLHTRAVWGALEGRESLLIPASEFLPGGAAYPGTLLVVLAALGLADRLRGRRGEDLRGSLLLATLLLVWFVVIRLPLPGVPDGVPSLYALLQTTVPGMDAVRAIGAVRIGVGFTGAICAGYGIVALRRTLPVRLDRPVAVALLAAAYAANFVFPAGVERVDQEPYRAAPPPGLETLLGRLPPGAVLDVPVSIGMPPFASHQLFLGAWHDRPMAACTNSFVPPVRNLLGEWSVELPALPALQRFWLLGFRSLLVHLEAADGADRIAMQLRYLKAPLRLLGVASDHMALQFDTPVAFTTDLDALGADFSAPPQEGLAARAPVAFVIRNPGALAFRHPDPIEPTPLLVRWTDPDGTIGPDMTVRVLLPLALLPKESATIAVTLDVPARPGTHAVSLRLRGQPSHVAALARVRVVEPEIVPHEPLPPDVLDGP